MDVKWMLPVCDNDRHNKEPFVVHNAKYHCFTADDKSEKYEQIGSSLCGKYKQNMDYETDIESGQIPAFPTVACQRCFRKWKREFQVDFIN